MSEQFFGKFKLETSENFDAFLKEIGINLIKRKLANMAYPTLDITKDENDYVTIKTISPFKTHVNRFRVGEEFDEERIDGKVVKSIVNNEGNTFIQTQKDEDLTIKYIREFTGDQIKVTSIANNVQCFRVYKRIE